MKVKYTLSLVVFNILAISNAFSAPPGTPTASDGMSFSGVVALECSVQSQSFVSANGGTPKSYIITSTPAGGGNTDIVNNTVAEERVVMLEATDTIGFDCNSNAFGWNVDMDTLTAPNSLSNATNIDLVVNAAVDIGVDHQVKIELLFPAGASPTIPIQAYSSDLSTGISIGGVAFFPVIDRNGDLEISLSSRFILVNAAEELAAGTYGSTYTVTVTAL